MLKPHTSGERGRKKTKIEGNLIIVVDQKWMCFMWRKLWFAFMFYSCNFVVRLRIKIIAKITKIIMETMLLCRTRILVIWYCDYRRLSWNQKREKEEKNANERSLIEGTRAVWRKRIKLANFAYLYFNKWHCYLLMDEWLAPELTHSGNFSCRHASFNNKPAFLVSIKSNFKLFIVLNILEEFDFWFS